jgi:hypothetical protein
MRRAPASHIAEDRQPEASGPSSKFNSDGDHENMDEMRCILYIHGGGYWTADPVKKRVFMSLPLGGYYFGSVDQQR